MRSELCALKEVGDIDIVGKRGTQPYNTDDGLCGLYLCDTVRTIDKDRIRPFGTYLSECTSNYRLDDSAALVVQ